MLQLSATKVAREFSSVLNRVDAGEEVEVLRNGVPVAQMRPARSGRTMSASRWRDLMASAPSVDEDFERDVLDARRDIGPPSGAWPS
jgi:antitoxin (DNA-binding transcriptional repressor) of toxin-antitoxin stability system